MKFNNQFFATVSYFVNGILSRHYFGYKQPWLYTKFAALLTWLGCTHAEHKRTEVEEYEDPWTNDSFVHLVELSDGQKLPILCASVSEAWDRIESWLFEKSDFETTIIKITKDEW